MLDLVSLNRAFLRDYFFKQRTQGGNIPLPLPDLIKHLLTRILLREVKFLIERIARDNDAQILVKDDQRLMDGIYNRSRENMAIFYVTERV